MNQSGATLAGTGGQDPLADARLAAQQAGRVYIYAVLPLALHIKLAKREYMDEKSYKDVDCMLNFCW